MSREPARTTWPAGTEVELAPRQVDVFRLELTRFAYPELELAIDCGSGTYVRSIGRDLGRALGCGAVMSALVRTRIGPYRIEDAVALEQLTPETIDQLLLPATRAVEGLPKYLGLRPRRRTDPIRPALWFLSDKGTAATAPGGAPVAVLDGDGELLCLAEFDAQCVRLLPRRVFID